MRGSVLTEEKLREMVKEVFNVPTEREESLVYHDGYYYFSGPGFFTCISATDFHEAMKREVKNPKN